MVESIYGGKVFPHNHDRNSLLLQRRFSTGTSCLQPISEASAVDIGGEAVADRTFLFVESTVTEHMPISRSGRPRAYSLPAIYRDGSYLRIELPDEACLGASQNRRFSEPGVAGSSVPRGRIPSTLGDPRGTRLLPFGSPSTIASDVPEAAEHERTRWRAFRPAAHARKQRPAELGVARTRSYGDVNNLVNSANLCSEAVWTHRNKHATGNYSRSRQTFSLPPMPLNTAVHRVKSCASPKERRWSYPPPTKADLDRLARKLPGIVSSGGRGTSNGASCFSGEECEIELGGQAAPREPEPLMNSPVDILTRWMKFFG